MLLRVAKKAFGLLLIMAFAGCSVFSQRQLEKVEYMRKGSELSASADEIRMNLEKNQSNAGGFFEVYMMPLTGPYLKARRSEMGLLRGLNSQEKEKLKHKEYELYLKGKNCFQVGLQVVRHREAIEIEQWEASAVDHQGRFHELDWVRVGPAIEGRYQTTHGKVAQWVLSADLCSSDKMLWEKGLEVVLTPNFTPWPFPKTMNFQWVFEGPREERKKKKKSYKRYRGY